VHERAFHDDVAEKADRLDRRNAIIVSTVGVFGVTVAGALLVLTNAVL